MQLLDGLLPPINVLDSLDEGRCTVDHNLRITYLNASAERICKNRLVGLIGRRLKEAGPEFAGDELLQALQLSLGDGQIRRIDLTTSPAAG
jgi:PAS domain-containing protein